MVLCALAVLPATMHFCQIVLPVMPGPRIASTTVAYLSSGMSLALFYAVAGYLVAIPVLIIVSRKAPKEARRTHHWFALALFCGLAAVILLFRPTWDLRMWFLWKLPARAQALTAALDDYRQDHGQYPSSLGALVPDYLPRIPDTGLMADPDFYYERAVQGEWLASYGVGYDLSVSCSTAVLGWDSMHYWPTGEYPDQAWGGVIEEIDGWAYVHE
jgi:hypothetical protein